MAQKLGGVGHLFYFTSLQLIIYSDRSLLAGLMPNVQIAFDIGDTRGGLLGSGFMGGFMIMSPFVTLARGKTVCPTIGVSLILWMIAEVVTCFAPTYTVLLLARILAGAGEAGFCALGPPLIDDTAPSSMRSLFVAIYYSAVFVGMAIGFVTTVPLADWKDGRFAFLALAAVMAPYVCYILVCGNKFHVALTSTEHQQTQHLDHVASQPLEGQVPAGTLLEVDRAVLYSTKRDSWCVKLQPISHVLRCGTFDFLVLGFAASQFVIGGFAFWASDYLQNDLALGKDVTGVALGLMTVATGVLGSASGGALLDILTKLAKARWNRDEGVRGVVGCGLCVFLSVCVVPAACLASLLKNDTAFLVCLGGTQVFSFLGAAPFIMATMDSVPTDFRGTAMGLSTFGGHLLGDLFSPTLVGKVADVTGSLRQGMFCLSIWSVWCPIMWSVAYCLASQRLGSRNVVQDCPESCISMEE